MVQRNLAIRLSSTGGEAVRRDFLRLGAEGSRALDRVERASVPASRGLLAVNRAAGTLKGGLLSTASRLGPLGSALSALGPGGLAAAAGIGAITIALGKALQGARQAVEAFDAIAKTADRIGIGTDALQELRFAAELSGIKVSQLDSGLEAFTKRLGEVRAGTGTLTTFLGRFDAALLENVRNARSTEEALDLILAAMADTETAADRAALSAAAFGRTAGVEMANLVRDGTDALDAMRRQARELGIVIDEQVLRKAEQTSDKLTVMQRVIDANLNRALVDLAPVLVWISGLFADMARWVGEVVDGFREIDARSTRGLEARLAEINTELDRLRATREALGRGGDFLGGLLALPEIPGKSEAEKALERERAAIEAQLALRTGSPVSPPPGAPPGEPPPDLDANLAALRARLDETGAAIRNYRKDWQVLFDALGAGKIQLAEYERLLGELNRRFAETGERPAGALPGFGGVRPGQPKPAEDPITRRRAEVEVLAEQVRRMRELAAAYREGAAAVAEVALRQEIENEARRRGIDLQSEEGRQLAELIRQRSALAEAISEGQRDLGQDVEDSRLGLEGFADDLRGAFGAAIGNIDSAEAALSRFLQTLSSAALDRASGSLLDLIFGKAGSEGGGLFGALLGSLGGGGSFDPGVGPGGKGFLTFGGPRMHGGPVQPGSAFLVGERGPELFVPERPGTVLDRDRTTALLRGERVASVRDMDSKRAADTLERVERLLDRRTRPQAGGTTKPPQPASQRQQQDAVRAMLERSARNR